MLDGKWSCKHYPTCHDTIFFDVMSKDTFFNSLRGMGIIKENKSLIIVYPCQRTFPVAVHHEQFQIKLELQNPISMNKDRFY